jgi:LmbE family N-acetylglucosaminyl deacetylase
MLNTHFRGSVLVIAPHFDDEVLGCGGTLLRFRSQMDRLTVVHIAAASERREAEFGNVRTTLSVDEHYALQQEDGFCGKNSSELTLSLVRVIQLESPDVVLVPHGREAHADHRTSWCVTLDAVEKARYWRSAPTTTTHRVPLLLAYEVWTPLSHPSFVCDVTEYFEGKCSLLRSYESQLEDFPYIDYIRAFNGWRGLVHHRRGQAEAFAARSI